MRVAAYKYPIGRVSLDHLQVKLHLILVGGVSWQRARGGLLLSEKVPCLPSLQTLAAGTHCASGCEGYLPVR